MFSVDVSHWVMWLLYIYIFLAICYILLLSEFLKMSIVEKQTYLGRCPSFKNFINM